MSYTVPQVSNYRRVIIGVSPAPEKPRDIRDYSARVQLLLIAGLLGVLASFVVLVAAAIVASSALVLLTGASGLCGVAFLMLGLAGQTAKREDRSRGDTDWVVAGSFDAWNDARGSHDRPIRLIQPANDQAGRFRALV